MSCYDLGGQFSPEAVVSFCSRWYTFHFNTSSHLCTRAISLTTLNPLHANLWRARSQIELFLLCRMMAYHYRCFGKPFASLASSNDEQLFKKNCEPNLKNGNLQAFVPPFASSMLPTNKLLDFNTKIPVVVNIERSKKRSKCVRILFNMSRTVLVRLILVILRMKPGCG